jgi:radical SAM-linked protein
MPLKGSALKMRYSIKFSKESEIKFISHLDLAKTIQRIVKRSELPIQYSQGFNPHMAISIGQPLSVGMYSEGEYMDMDFTERLDEEFIKTKLNSNVPRGIKIHEVVFVPERENVKNPPQAMAAVEEAEYEIRIKYDASKDLNEEIKKLLAEDEWNIVKKSKSGEKEVNIKTMVKDFHYSILADFLFIKTTIACGSKENLSAQLLAEFISINTNGVDKEAFVDIKRKEMYAYKNNNRYPLYKLYQLKWH